MLIIDI